VVAECREADRDEDADEAVGDPAEDRAETVARAEEQVALGRRMNEEDRDRDGKAEAVPGQPPPDPGLPRRAIGDSLCVAGVGEGARFACNCCNQPLGPVSGNYRLACATLAVAPADLDPEIYPDPAQFCDDELVLRQTLCPRCATLLAQDFCLKSEPIRCDVRLDPATLERS